MVDPIQIQELAQKINKDTLSDASYYQNVVSTADKAINDLLHDLELANLSGKDLLLDAVAIREWRRARRWAKNILVCIEKIRRHQLSPAHIKRHLNKIQKQKHYNIRVLKNLKIAQEAKS